MTIVTVNTWALAKTQFFGQNPIHNPAVIVENYSLPARFPKFLRVPTYSHSVTYVSDNILKRFKDIVRLVGLDLKGLVADRNVLMRGLETWLDTGHLNKVVLEIFYPSTGKLVGRWDVDIVYGWSGDGEFWIDPDQVRYHIQKVGLAPSNVTYRIVVENRANHPRVEGWDSTSFRSTDGFVQQSLGLTINHSGLGGGFSYWRPLCS